MDRRVLVSFLVACLLVCVVQAFPQHNPFVVPTTASKIETAISDAVQSFQRGLQGLKEDPKLNQLFQDGQRAIEDIAASIKTGAAKMMPQTDRPST